MVKTCITNGKIEYLLKCSSRHRLQNLWPHFVSTGFFNANWQIAHCKSSSTSLTNSSSYPPRDAGIAWTSTVFNRALTRRKDECARASALFKSLLGRCIDIFNWALTTQRMQKSPADQVNRINSISWEGRRYSFVSKVLGFCMRKKMPLSRVPIVTDTIDRLDSNVDGMNPSRKAVLKRLAQYWVLFY